MRKTFDFLLKREYYKHINSDIKTARNRGALRERC